MKAWVVTWEWMSPSASVADRVAAVLPPRWSDARVASFVEFLYIRANATLTEMAAYAKNPGANPYPSRIGMSVDGFPQGGRVTCGHQPWLYARQVTNLRVSADPGTGLETIEWDEPDVYRLNESGNPELSRRGKHVSHGRSIAGALSDERTWRTWADEAGSDA